jgi:hypothetical protein
VFGGIVGDQVVAFGEGLGAASREIDAAGELLCQCGVSGLFSSGKLRDLPPYALALKWSGCRERRPEDQSAAISSAVLVSAFATNTARLA